VGREVTLPLFPIMNDERVEMAIATLLKAWHEVLSRS